MSSSFPIYTSPVATAVPFDNSTNGFNSTDVQSAIEEASHKLSAFEASSTASATAPVSTDALMTGMTLTPVAGTYLVMFSSDINSAVAGATISVSIYVGGVQKADSLRKYIPLSGGLLSGAGRAAAATNGIVTVNGSQAVEIRWSTSNSGPTTAARTLNLLRIL